MNHSWLKGLAAATLAAALLSPVGAHAQEAGAFGEWDANADGLVDEAEWRAGWEKEGVFGEWDANDDNMLDNEEVGAGLYGAYDADGTAGLSEEEFGAAEGLFEDD